jgi:hypothetical protein
MEHPNRLHMRGKKGGHSLKDEREKQKDIHASK